MQKNPMVTIFNGRRRSLGGEDVHSGIFIQLYKELQPYLKEFTSAQWLVFTAIAFHIDADGWAWPGREKLAFDTGLNIETVKVALEGLCRLRIEGNPVLLKYQPRRGEEPAAYVQKGGGQFLSNHYLIFPSWEEVRIFSGKGVKRGTVPWVEKPSTVEPSTVEPSTEKPYTNNTHNKQYPCSDGVLELLGAFGVRRTKKVKGLALRFSVDEVERVLAAASVSGVENPQGLVVSMLENGDVPAEEGAEGEDYKRFTRGKYAHLYERREEDGEDG